MGPASLADDGGSQGTASLGRHLLSAIFGFHAERLGFEMIGKLQQLPGN